MQVVRKNTPKELNESEKAISPRAVPVELTETKVVMQIEDNETHKRHKKKFVVLHNVPQRYKGAAVDQKIMDAWAAGKDGDFTAINFCHYLSYIFPGIFAMPKDEYQKLVYEKGRKK